MKIIVPMAGRGSRLRPHTLTIPKPLIPIAGKPIVQRLVEDIAKVCNDTIDEIAFIIGDFGEEVEQQLLGIAKSLNAKGIICYQEEALGTAHAILCAKESLQGNIVVAFADTLFKADFKLNTDKDGIIWVNEIDDPSAFGVVKENEEGIITDFIEKPTTFVSNKAIIGIYYFKDGEDLKQELQYLIDNNIKEKGEFQLTNALENMKQKGRRFTTGSVEEWLDCGNYKATIYTNQRILEITKTENNSNEHKIIPPCFIGKNVKIDQSSIGPHVSIGDNTTVVGSVIKNTIIQNNTEIIDSKLQNSMVGNYAKIEGLHDKEISVGDYTEIK